jgi:anti-anti-sigma factor
MKSDAVLVIDQRNMVATLDNAAKKMESESQIALDVSGVARVDSPGLRALQDLVHKAGEKNVKVVLRGMNINVYKTLQLAHLTRSFSFAN